VEIEFLGAARTVTGSMHLVHARQRRILLDCGMFQGRRRESIERNRHLPFAAGTLDAVVLSHAHIDHSGALPMLARSGFRGTIFATPATRDLLAAMLEDAAMIQQADARYINKQIARGASDMDPVEPLYDQDDVLAALNATVTIPYHRPHPIAPGVTLTFLDAGHVLGSAVTVLDIDEGTGAARRVVFTGDLGRKNMPILRDPKIAEGANVLITESTYGNRLHSPIGEMDEALASILHATYRRGGKVIIPSFALERAQELLYALSRLRHRGLMPPMRVHVDSPLTVKITDVFKVHPECYDAETRARLQSDDSPFDFDGVDYVADKYASQQLDAGSSPSVIISASGMCEAGRVLHHLKATIEDPRNSIVIVGFQAQHTLGRRLVERRARVKIFGVERDLRAEVHVLNGFSAHADQADLLAYAEAVRERGDLEHVALVHGEPPAQAVLHRLLEQRGFRGVITPLPRDRLTF
jgi:metallo-beta-lactamase family protein